MCMYVTSVCTRTFEHVSYIRPVRSGEKMRGGEREIRTSGQTERQRRIEPPPQKKQQQQQQQQTNKKKEAKTKNKDKKHRGR